MKNQLKSFACGSIIVLETYFLPMLILTIRIWMAKAFLSIGVTKLLGWQSTTLLFKYEYQFPVFGYIFWAVFSTATEIISPILIIIGLFTRIASFPMLVLTAVIEFTYIQVTEHYYWAMLIGTLILFGPSTISVDHFIRKRHLKV